MIVWVLAPGEPDAVDVRLFSTKERAMAAAPDVLDWHTDREGFYGKDGLLGTNLLVYPLVVDAPD